MTITLPKNNNVDNLKKFKFSISQWYGESWEGEIEGDISEIDDLIDILMDESKMRGMDSPNVTMYRWIPAPNEEWESEWLSMNDYWDEHELDKCIKDWEIQGVFFDKSTFEYK